MLYHLHREVGSPVGDRSGHQKEAYPLDKAIDVKGCFPGGMLDPEEEYRRGGFPGGMLDISGHTGKECFHEGMLDLEVEHILFPGTRWSGNE